MGIPDAVERIPGAFQVTHVSLFAGIGGLDLAAEWAGFESVLQVERDPYCLRVLAKHWPAVPRLNDVREVHTDARWRNPTVVSGGFPCQPFSQAGKRAGSSDDRHLWPQMLRVIQELSPAYVVGENVSGLLSIDGGLVFETVCADLEREGYDVLPLHYPASGVGAPHKRDRVFIVAHAARELFHGSGSQKRPQPELANGGQDVADAEGKRRGQRRAESTGQRGELRTTGCRAPCRGSSQWSVEPDVCGISDGLSRKLDGGIDADQRRIPVSCQETTQRLLREVWNDGELECAPQGRGYHEQFTEQYPDLVLELSHGASLARGEASLSQARTLLRRVRKAIHARSVRYASHTPEEAWQSLSRETKDWVRVAACRRTHWDAGEWYGVPRVATGVKNRVDRLRALGNAVVPQQAYPIFAAIAETMRGK